MGVCRRVLIPINGQVFDPGQNVLMQSVFSSMRPKGLGKSASRSTRPTAKENVATAGFACERCLAFARHRSARGSPARSERPAIRAAVAAVTTADFHGLPPYGNGTLPTGVRSRLVPNVNGLTVNLLEAGYETPGRPLVLLLHGFPNLAYSWRKVMPALAAAGYYAAGHGDRPAVGLPDD
jgi:hypothetical protein